MIQINIFKDNSLFLLESFYPCKFTYGINKIITGVELERVFTGEKFTIIRLIFSPSKEIFLTSNPVYSQLNQFELKGIFQETVQELELSTSSD